MVSAEAFIGASGIAETEAALPIVTSNAAKPASTMRFMCHSLCRTMRRLAQVPDPKSVPGNRNEGEELPVKMSSPRLR
jgi:hypothetical protein